MKLDASDLRHLNAALGWLELGNNLEAHAEIENIAPTCRSQPAVLELRWQIYAKEKKWGVCVDISKVLVAANPKRPDNWLNQAYALRRASGGGLSAAEALLFVAWQKFPLNPIVPYNLACYACQLGKLKQAWDWLEKAFDIGNPKALKLMALDDPDLEPLWAEIGEI